VIVLAVVGFPRRGGLVSYFTAVMGTNQQSARDLVNARTLDVRAARQLNNLTPGAAERHNDGNMAVIDR
jgi:hypothetical protein